MFEPRPFDENVRELRELIARMEQQHRENMRPYYEHLCRYEAMQLRPMIVRVDQISPDILKQMQQGFVK